MKIPFHRPNIPNKLDQILPSSVKSGWLTTGYQVNIFEKELEKTESIFKSNNIVFDKTSNFILYPSVNGVKLVNIYTKKIVTVIGKGENLRFLNISLSQASDEVVGAAGEKDPSLAPQSIEMHVSENPGLVNKSKPAPVLFCTAHKKNRFYLLREKLLRIMIQTVTYSTRSLPKKREILQ